MLSLDQFIDKERELRHTTYQKKGFDLLFGCRKHLTKEWYYECQHIKDDEGIEESTSLFKLLVDDIFHAVHEINGVFVWYLIHKVDCRFIHHYSKIETSYLTL